MTVLFSDIRNFTTLSEGMTPQENFNFIGSYLQRMGPCIRNHGGFIDKYIGDAIMALFAKRPDNALYAMIDMFRELAIYNQHRSNSGYPAIAVGIGVHTGNVMLGVLGERERMNVSVISDTVNLAARMETITKFYRALTLVTDDVVAALTHPATFHLRKVGQLPVRGRSRPVTAYEVLDCYRNPRLFEALIDGRAHFEAGVHAMIAQDLPLAATLFREVLHRNSFDRVARAHLERISQTLGHPAEKGARVARQR